MHFINLYRIHHSFCESSPSVLALIFNIFICSLENKTDGEEENDKQKGGQKRGWGGNEIKTEIFKLREEENKRRKEEKMDGWKAKNQECRK